MKKHGNYKDYAQLAHILFQYINSLQRKNIMYIISGSNIYDVPSIKLLVFKDLWFLKQKNTNVWLEKGKGKFLNLKIRKQALVPKDCYPVRRYLSSDIKIKGLHYFEKSGCELDLLLLGKHCSAWWRQG